ncbi:uncharacterized protein LOC132629941 isoform X2 [Lycium barbarum]|uniref:uncharacterized protein LOC132629941 isoform X2 n=1 Tax=Lycium barbarum TaxID=112863 RepID=UPI00293E1FDF|nr:uncharacterized protein LOC132629941 isoform X2 [Lycium barbarum]
MPPWTSGSRKQRLKLRCRQNTCGSFYTQGCGLVVENHEVSGSNPSGDKNTKCVVDELACLLKDAEAIVQSINCSLAQRGELNVDNGTYSLETSHDGTEAQSIDLLKHEVIDTTTLMAIVYSMVKSDYTMQEKIVSSLNLTSPSGELESYSSMWSLRPYIDDEIMHKAWKLVR